MQSTKVSLVIITKNEEKNIERCIRSVPFAAEVVVLDSGSTDDTAALARELGATVFEEPWRGFGQQKIRATELAKNDWILSLDADEALSPEAQAEIQKLLAAGSGALSADAYALPRKTQYLGRWMEHSGMYPDFQKRLFHRARAKWLDVPVHEHIVAKNIVRLKGDILHWSFASIAHQIETINKYSGLRAQQFKVNGRTFSPFKMIGKGLSKFIETYFLKRGFLDGRAGIIVCVVSSFATVLRWAKLYELELADKNKSLAAKGKDGV